MPENTTRSVRLIDSAQSFIAVALGGSIGAVVRAILVKTIGSGKPYSIALVNLLGCFLFGYYLPRFQSPVVANFLFVGLLGSLTTFSTFTSDNIKLLDQSSYLYFALNILGQVGLGLIIFKIAYHLGKHGTV